MTASTRISTVSSGRSSASRGVTSASVRISIRSAIELALRRESSDDFGFFRVPADSGPAWPLKSFCVVVVDKCSAAFCNRDWRNLGARLRMRRGGDRAAIHQARDYLRPLYGSVFGLLFGRLKLFRRGRQHFYFVRRIPFHKLNRRSGFFPCRESSVLQIQRSLAAHIMRMPRYPANLVS